MPCMWGIFKGKVNPDSDFKPILGSVDHEKLPRASRGNEAQRGKS